MDSKKKKGKFLVITAPLVPEANYVEEEQLVREIRQKIEKTTIPWVKEILKVTISDYLFED